MSRSSQFVDDIRRLRKAGGLVTTKTGNLERSEKVIFTSSEEARTDYPTSKILNSKNPAAAKIVKSVQRSPSALAQDDLGISAVVARAKRTVMTGTGGQQEAGREAERVLDGGYYHVPSFPPKRRLPRPRSAPTERGRDVVERLRRVVREAMSFPGNYQVSS